MFGWTPKCPLARVLLGDSAKQCPTTCDRETKTQRGLQQGNISGPDGQSRDTGHRHASRHLLTGNITGQGSSASSRPAGTQSPALGLQQKGLRLQRNQKE